MPQKISAEELADDTPPVALRKMPKKGSVAAIRERVGKGQFEWHLATVLRINNKKQMRVSVVYFHGEPYEHLNLNNKQWGLVTGPSHVGHRSRQYCSTSKSSGRPRGA